MPKRQLIAFDLDDTLAITKSPISDRMSELLGKLIEKYDVCVITGGKYEQIKMQVVDRIDVPKHLLGKLHLMPTCGTRYFRYDELKDEWALQYADDLSDEDKKQIIEVTEKHARAMNLWPENPFGEVIEDRLSQISISMLGQQAPAEQKYAWAEKYSEQRLELRAAIAEELPRFEVRAGGTTTIDITHIGIDKAYGMEKLVQALEISKNDILFIGDKLEEGGNDYPVKAMGIDTVAVDGWEDTALVLEGILAVS